MTCVIPSQSYILSLFSNASRSMHCSSVEALCSLCSYYYLKVFNYCDNRIVIAKCDVQPIAWDLLMILTSVAGKLCHKCTKWLLEQNSIYSDYFNAISGLYRTAEAQETL